MSQPRKRRAFGYLRVSTPGQAKDGTSLATQREAIESLAASNDLQVVDWFEDAGISGTSVDKRPELVRLLKAVEDGLADVVISFDLKRFTRDYHEGGRDAIEEISQHAEFWTVIEGFRAGQNDSAADVFTRDIFGAVGAFEAREIKEKMIRGRKARIRNGGWIGGPPPYGFDLETRGSNKSRNSILIQDPADVKTIRMIYDMAVNQGRSFRDIYRHLSLTGVETSSQSLARKRNLPDIPQSKVWNHGLRDFVERHLDWWAGSKVVRYWGEEFTVTPPAILTPVEIRKLRAATAAAKGVRQQKRPSPLNGHITGKCGRKMTSIRTRAGTHLFKCRDDLSFREDGTTRAVKDCDCFGVSLPDLTEAVFEMVTEVITDPDWLAAVLNERRGSGHSEIASFETKVEDLEARIEAEQVSIAETVSELRKQGVSAVTIASVIQELDVGLETLRQQLDQAEKSLRRARQAVTIDDDLRSTVERTASMLASDDPAVRKQIVDILDLRVEIVDYSTCSTCEGKRRIKGDHARSINTPERFYLRSGGATCPTCVGIGALPGWSVYGHLPLVATLSEASAGVDVIPFRVAA